MNTIHIIHTLIKKIFIYYFKEIHFIKVDNKQDKYYVIKIIYSMKIKKIFQSKAVGRISSDGHDTYDIIVEF